MPLYSHVKERKNSKKIYLHILDVRSWKTTQLETVFLDHICGRAGRVFDASGQYKI